MFTFIEQIVVHVGSLSVLNICDINLYIAIHMQSFEKSHFFTFFHFFIIVFFIGQRTPLEISPRALMGYPSTNNVLKLLFLIHFCDILCDNHLLLY